MKHRFLLPASLCGALLLCSASALADDTASNAECVAAYEHAQEQRQSGQLVAARAGLRACSSDACPGFIRTDCTTWYEEVESEIPTVVFAVRSRGRDLSEVRIATGDRLLTSHIDGQIVELDPGAYTLRFEADALPPLEQTYVIARGERNRLIAVELPATVEPRATPSHRPPTQPSVSPWPGVLLGVGAAGVGGFLGLGLWGRNAEDKLKESCAPQCSESRVAEVRTRYFMADAALGVGLASLGLGAYLFFAGESASPRTGSSVPKLTVAAGPGVARFTYGGAF